MGTGYPAHPWEVEAHARYQAIAERIPADVLDELRALHKTEPGGCTAHWEGQTCCMDYLTVPDLDLRRWGPP